MRTGLGRMILRLLLAFACSVSLRGAEGASKHCAASQDPGRAAGAEEPLAIVAGQPLYERDIQDTVAAQMLKLRQQEYQIKSQALEDLIRQRVVEAEARKRGVTVDKLYADEVDAKIPAPSDDEVEGYYLAVKAQLNKPFQDLKTQLREAVKALKVQQGRQEYADALRAKSDTLVLLALPKVNIGYDPSRVRGNPSALITIVEFSDFQCPFCKQVQATLKDLLSKYDGRVKVAFRDFPMRALHPQAQISAEASRCAEAQGKFWEYHDALFAAQTKLDEPELEATAGKLGLDEEAFHACLSTGKFKAAIDQDVQEGTKVGVAGTPGFFINGEFVNGNQPETQFVQIIDRQLAAAQRASAARLSP